MPRPQLYAEPIDRTIRFPSALLERIKALAEADDRSVNWLVVRACEEMADREETSGC